MNDVEISIRNEVLLKLKFKICGIDFVVGVSSEEVMVRGWRDGELYYDGVKYLVILFFVVVSEIGDKLVVFGERLEDIIFIVYISY